MNTLIVGLQYGDEGKGRVSETVSKHHDWCARFNGGPNAGHTVYDKEGRKHAFHHLPAGVVHGKKIALDTGMVIDFAKLKQEIDSFGLGHIKLYISENVHIICEDHLEKDKNGSGVGTTKSGIAYVYADRALKTGVRCGTLSTWWDDPAPTVYKGLIPAKDTESILFESAQGIMLDIDYGCYPYTTSSSVMPSSVYRIAHKIGVIKAYTSRVGDGPPYVGLVEKLTEKGQEFGTTTGRPRKCYWVDTDELDYAISIVQPDEIVVTKLDILEGEDIHIVKDKQVKRIGDLSEYISFLTKKYPQISQLSFSPKGKFQEI